MFENIKSRCYINKDNFKGPTNGVVGKVWKTNINLNIDNLKT